MLNTIIAIPFFLHDPYSTATSTTKITTVKASGSFHVIVSLSTKNRSFKFSHCSITEIELVLLTNTSDGFTIKLNFNFFFDGCIPHHVHALYSYNKRICVPATQYRL